MIIEQMSMTVPHGKRQELGTAIAALTGPTQAQPGCLSCRLFQSWAKSDELRLETRWADTEDLMRHMQSDRYKRLLLLMELAAAAPLLEFHTVLEVHGLDLVHAARDSLD
jgi:quinol monooxygenase YgiN